MPNQLESFTKFNKALEEVGRLMGLASICEDMQSEYAALNKSALLLLTAKFEVFVEDIVEEYVENINSMNVANLLISEQLKIRHSITRIKELSLTIEHVHNEEKSIQVLKELAELWQEQEATFVGLNISNKFNYGKHGARELRKLFSNIEISNVFETIVLYSDNEHSLLENSQVINFEVIYNNIVNLRNQISHQDKTPNMTHKQIEGYVVYFNRFSKKLCLYLEEKLRGLGEQYEAYKQTVSTT
ncbi:MAE_28990/MAE_18760 family HEPN-like nuclease [Sporosarcina sp. FSL K6-2383]|uniref:MAE_28990/MAE_18760 family HEPN-like nuclease n=1 Tax=Sporosarcina sp. FSL K6-2383 TaxID=2921556 RepID=UPI00315A0E84